MVINLEKVIVLLHKSKSLILGDRLVEITAVIHKQGQSSIPFSIWPKRHYNVLESVLSKEEKLVAYWPSLYQPMKNTAKILYIFLNKLLHCKVFVYYLILSSSSSLCISSSKNLLKTIFLFLDTYSYTASINPNKKHINGQKRVYVILI